MLTEAERKNNKKLYEKKRYESQRQARCAYQREYYAHNRARILQWHRNYKKKQKYQILNTQ